MGAQRRHYEREALYHVSNQTIRGHAFFTPTEEVEAVVMNNLAWAADKHGVEVYTYLFQPDRFDMIVSSEYLTISDFMGDFEGLTARELNALHGESGKFFAGTFECTKLETDVMVEDLARIMDEPRARGFVEDASDWEGVSAWGQLREGTVRIGVRVDRTLARELRRADKSLTEEEALTRATSSHVLELARLPGFEDMSREEYWDAIADELEHHGDRDTSVALEYPERSSIGDEATTMAFPSMGDQQTPSPLSRTVGMTAIRSWPTSVRVLETRRRRPVYRTRRRVLRQRELEARRWRNVEYDWARKRLRNGTGEPRFPEGMIPLHKTRPVGATRPPPLIDGWDSRLAA